jgi:probable rRNA maturation factor
MEITLKNFQKKIPIPQAKILKAAKAAFCKLEKNKDVPRFFKKKGRRPYFSIVFVGTKRMRAVNKKYLGHDYVTDVLTFDFGEAQAEIVICPRVASINARLHQTSTENEIVLYVIHGILHLAGYDDHKPHDMLQMRRMEKKLL